MVVVVNLFALLVPLVKLDTVGFETGPLLVVHLSERLRANVSEGSRVQRNKGNTKASISVNQMKPLSWLEFQPAINPSGANFAIASKSFSFEQRRKRVKMNRVN